MLIKPALEVLENSWKSEIRWEYPAVDKVSVIGVARNQSKERGSSQATALSRGNQTERDERLWDYGTERNWEWGLGKKTLPKDVKVILQIRESMARLNSAIPVNTILRQYNPSASIPYSHLILADALRLCISQSVTWLCNSERVLCEKLQAAANNGAWSLGNRSTLALSETWTSGVMLRSNKITRQGISCLKLGCFLNCILEIRLCLDESFWN